MLEVHFVMLSIIPIGFTPKLLALFVYGEFKSITRYTADNALDLIKNFLRETYEHWWCDGINLQQCSVV